MTSSPSSAQPSSPELNKIPVEVAAAAWKPLLLRGAVALIFGLVTVFWTTPQLTAASFLLGAVMVVGGKSLFDFGSIPGAPEPMRRALGIGAMVSILAGLSVLPFQSEFVIAWMGGAGLALAGVCEVWAWAVGRKSFVPARDLLIPGVVTAGAGVAMMIGNQLDLHGLLGIAGGGHIIVAVFTLIAALTYRFDAK